MFNGTWLESAWLKVETPSHALEANPKLTDGLCLTNDVILAREHDHKSLNRLKQNMSGPESEAFLEGGLAKSVPIGTSSTAMQSLRAIARC